MAKRLENYSPVKMGGSGNIDLIYELTEWIKATKAIETGIGYGWSSLAFLFSIKKRKNSLLCSTDRPYPRRDNEPYVGIVVPFELRKYWRIIPYSDRKALPRALKIYPEIDICHYDSDKSVRGRLFAYSRLWNALRLGGILISDDIGDNLAFAYFCKVIKGKPIVVKFKARYIGILFKENGNASKLFN